MRGYRKANAFGLARVCRKEIEVALNLFRRHERFRERHAHSSTDSHFLDDLDGAFAMPVHIGKEHRPGLDHLEKREAAGRLDVVARKLGLERPDVFLQPFLERHVVGIPAQERHGGMRVPVVERGEQGKTGTVHDLGPCGNIYARFRNFGKAVALDKHVDNAVVAVQARKRRGFQHDFAHILSLFLYSS